MVRAGGAALGSAANASAHNRGVDVDIARAQLRQQAERDFYDQTIRRDESGRANQRQAWDLMNRAAYVERATGKSPGFAGEYSRDIQAPSDAQRSTAAIAREEIRNKKGSR
jgi:hypothetical protein